MNILLPEALLIEYSPISGIDGVRVGLLSCPSQGRWKEGCRLGPRERAESGEEGIAEFKTFLNK